MGRSSKIRKAWTAGNRKERLEKNSAGWLSFSEGPFYLTEETDQGLVGERWELRGEVGVVHE